MWAKTKSLISATYPQMKCQSILLIMFSDMDAPLGEEVGYPGFKDLPFGAVEDPINELYLSATWPSHTENTIVDNDVYS